MRTHPRFAYTLLITISFVLLVSPSTFAATFTVSNLDDSGAGSLRQAIIDANALAGADIIDFSVSGTIFPESQLPALSDNTGGTTIDGGGDITLDGDLLSGTENGIQILSSNNVVRDMIIVRFPDDGIEISGASAVSNLVAGCYIGTDVNGTIALGNGGAAVLVGAGVFIESGATSNNVGDGTPAGRNIISGNSTGIAISDSGTSNNAVLGNYIGTDVTGTSALGNLFQGVVLFSGATSNTIGDGTAGGRNIISGNDRYGIDIRDSGTSNNSVLGNYIGTDVSGTAALGNTFNGITIWDGTTSNMIGDGTVGGRNIISGNDRTGIEIFGLGTSNNSVLGNYIGTDVSGTVALGTTGAGIRITISALSNMIGDGTAGGRNVISGNGSTGVAIGNGSNNSILGNYIGTDATGTVALGNAAYGVAINGASNNVGGTLEGEGNIIAYNGEAGVTVFFGAPNSIQGNSIHDNFGKGIDMAGGGIAVPDVTGLAPITGSVAGAGTAELFIDADDEGETFIGRVTTLGDGSFTTNIDVFPFVSLNLTATYTDSAGNTSEFSTPRLIDVTQPLLLPAQGYATLTALILILAVAGALRFRRRTTTHQAP